MSERGVETVVVLLLCRHVHCCCAAFSAHLAQARVPDMRVKNAAVVTEMYLSETEGLTVSSCYR